MFQARSALEATCIIFYECFSVMMFFSAVIGLYSLYRKKMIAAFNLNENRQGTVLVFEKETIICFSQAKPFRKSHYSETCIKRTPY